MMVLADRRIALIHAALAGMEALWFALFFLLFWPAIDASVFRYAGWIIVGALGWTLLLDVAGLFAPDSVAYRWWIIGVLLLSTLLLIRSVVYARTPLGELGWLLVALDNAVKLDGGPRPEAVLLWTNVFLWLRASWSTNRNLTSLGVMNSFKMGFLLLLAGGMWHYFRGQTIPVGYMPVYLGLGLLGLTIARSDERASRALTEGRRLPLGRLVQFLGIVLGFVVVTAVLNRYLPAPIHAALDWLGIVVEIGAVLLQVLLVLAVILGTYIGQWLGRLLGLEMAMDPVPDNRASIQALVDELQRRLGVNATTDIVLAPALLTFLRYLPLLLLLGIFGLIFVVVARRQRRRARRLEDEIESGETFTPGDVLNRVAGQLQNLAGLVRRFGVNRQLLAAISVQNIYANVSRLAAHRGRPRPVSMPPDDYLPILSATFEGCDAALARITQAYMHVHYGDHPVSTSTLARLRADYQTVRRCHKSAGSQSRAGV